MGGFMNRQEILEQLKAFIYRRMITMKKTIGKLVLLIFCITVLLSGSGIAEGNQIITLQQEAEEQLQKELCASPLQT